MVGRNAGHTVVRFDGNLKTSKHGPRTHHHHQQRAYTDQIIQTFLRQCGQSTAPHAALVAAAVPLRAVVVVPVSVPAVPQKVIRRRRGSASFGTVATPAPVVPATAATAARPTFWVPAKPLPFARDRRPHHGPVLVFDGFVLRPTGAAAAAAAATAPPPPPPRRNLFAQADVEDFGRSLVLLHLLQQLMKGGLDVFVVFGRGFDEGALPLLRQLPPLLARHRTVVVQVALVAHQHDGDVAMGGHGTNGVADLVVNVLHHAKGLPRSDVVDQQVAVDADHVPR